MRVRGPILAGIVLLSVGALLLASRLGFDFSPQAIYAGNEGLLEEAEAFKDVFGHSDAVILGVLSATGEEDTLAPEALSWTVDFARRAERIDSIVQMESLPTLEFPAGPGVASPSSVLPLAEGAAVDEETSQAVRTLLERLPLLEGALVSADRKVSIFMLHLRADAREVDEMKPVVDALRALARTRPPPDGYELAFSGLPVIRTDIVHDLEVEHVRMLPLCALVIVLVLTLAFHRIGISLLALAATAIGQLWTAAVLVLLGQSLNLISNILPILFFTIGMANAAHVVNRYAEECRRIPGDRRQASLRTLSHMGLACLLTYATTAIGFLSLGTARSQVLQEVGLQTAIGLALLYVTTMLVLGLMLPSFRPPPYIRPDEAGRLSLVRAVARAGLAVARHPWPVLLGGLLLVGVSLFLGRGLIVDCRMMETYEADHPSMGTLRRLEDEMSGVLTFDVDLRAEGPRGLLDPAFVRRLDGLSRFASTQPGVLQAHSFVDLQQEVRRLLAGAEEPPPLPPETDLGRRQVQAAHAACLLAGPSLHYGNLITTDGGRARLLVSVRGIGSHRLLQLFERIEAQLQEQFPDGAGVDARLTGDAYVFARAMDNFIHDVLRSFLGAILVIFGIIALLFRSLRLGFVSMLPNLTPLAITIGYMGLRGYDLNASNVIVFAIGLGIAVDNTIHFLARYREELAGDGSIPEAVQRTFLGAGRAILLTSLLILLGLSTLHGSEFVPTRRFAELTSVTMVAALIGDLFLLPACLVLMGGRKPVRG